MLQGEKRRLWIPSEEAYKSAGFPGEAAMSVLLEMLLLLAAMAGCLLAFLPCDLPD